MSDNEKDMLNRVVDALFHPFDHILGGCDCSRALSLKQERHESDVEGYTASGIPDDYYSADTEDVAELSSHGDEQAEIRAEAVRRIRCNETLKEIAENDSRPLVRAAALARIKRVDVRAHFALHDPSPLVREAAVWGVHSWGVLAHVFRNDSSPGVRDAAVVRCRQLRYAPPDGGKSEPRMRPMKYRR